MKLPRLLLLPLAAMLFFARSSADPLAVGATAPAVSGVADDGTTIAFADVYKKGLTLVYFFPKADTGGCTAQGCSLRDANEELARKGVTILGVSTDTVEAQKKFREKYHFPFTLIADHDQTVIKAFGVPVRDIPLMGPLASRQAYLIGKDGKILWADYKAKTDKQAEDVLAEVKRLGL